MTTATLKSVKAPLNQGLKAFSQAQDTVLSGVQSATELHLKAARDHGNAVVALATEVTKADPADAFRTLAENGQAFAQASFERAQRLAQDLFAVAQKTTEGLVDVGRNATSAA